MIALCTVQYIRTVGRAERSPANGRLTVVERGVSNSTTILCAVHMDSSARCNHCALNVYQIMDGATTARSPSHASDLSPRIRDIAENCPKAHTSIRRHLLTPRVQRRPRLSKPGLLVNLELRSRA